MALICPDCEVSTEPGQLICRVCTGDLVSWRSALNIGPRQLVLRFPDTADVSITSGKRLVLGRDPAHSSVAAALDHYEDVSREHALVRVDRDGTATIEHLPERNQTSVNGARLARGEPHQLHDGDTIRLGTTATFTVVFEPAIGTETGADYPNRRE